MIFIKPTEIELLEKIENAFKQSINEYKVLIVDIGNDNHSSSDTSSVNDTTDSGDSSSSREMRDKHIVSKVRETIKVPQKQVQGSLDVDLEETIGPKSTMAAECFDAQEIFQVLAILILFFTALSITN
jgi:hypothetical protein